jgi:cytochrome b6-f complex iron-sulfur subunit
MSDSDSANRDVAASNGDEHSQPSATRRAVVGTTIGVFGAGYAGALGYPIYSYLNTPVVRAASAAAVTELALPGAQTLKPGTATAFMFGIRPALLIHNQDGKWYSFDAVCTHLGCTVKFEADKDRIHCACHGGVYDPTTGQPVSGPPPRALTQYNVEVKDDEVVVSRA